MADKNRSFDNRFIEAIATVQKDKWCIAPWCTTCSHQDFRAATARIDDGTTNRTKELCDLPIAELTKYHGWDDCLRSVFERSHPITHKGMPVEMIIDQWYPSQRKYRFETFCYGPKSCSLYRTDPTRKVPGRRGMSWEEEDWVDEDATSHRSEDE